MYNGCVLTALDISYRYFSYLKVLADPAFVSFELLRQWTVRSLLLNVATHASKRFRALIDAGALVTGMRNQKGIITLIRLKTSLNRNGCACCSGPIFARKWTRRVGRVHFP